MTGAGLTTVGALSRRTGTPARALRAWTDIGLVYSAGRSPAGYRLYDESALWCVAVIGELRGLGLTIAEIRDLQAAGRNIGPARLSGETALEQGPPVDRLELGTGSACWSGTP